MKNFKNKRALVTGGTSGLGRALAQKLNDLGARVAVVARNRDGIERLRKTHPDILGLQADISDKRSIHPIVGEVHANWGGLDLLFNVASYLGETPLKLLADTSCEDFEKVLQTNLLGPFRLTKAVLPNMLLGQNGFVINISSDAAVNAYPRWGAYSVSKAAVDHLTRIFSVENQGTGVRFLSIDPGDMNTPMHFSAIPNADPSQLKDPDKAANEILNMIQTENQEPLRRAL